MTAWDFPAVIVAAVAVAVSLAWFLIRLANPPKILPDFKCLRCGRKSNGSISRYWHFCPYCGAPRKGDVNETSA